LILIKLFGALKKSCGSSIVPIEEKELPLSNIFQILKNLTENPDEISPDNLMILVNNVESSALLDDNKILRSGDVVTVVSMIHGG
jgi:molybdopterin converting factor small subunit